MVNAFQDTADISADGGGGWSFGDILSGAGDVLSTWWDREDDQENTRWARDYQDRKLDLEAKKLDVPDATKTPGNTLSSGRIDYQKWGLYLGVAGLILAALTFFMRKR